MKKYLSCLFAAACLSALFSSAHAQDGCMLYTPYTDGCSILLADTPMLSLGQGASLTIDLTGYFSTDTSILLLAYGENANNTSIVWNIGDVSRIEWDASGNGLILNIESIGPPEEPYQIGDQPMPMPPDPIIPDPEIPDPTLTGGIVPVPEPAAAAGLFGALALLFVLRRRK